MRMNERSRPALATALLLAASTATLSGCGKPEGKVASKACAGPAVAATVFVEYGGGIAKTRNKTVYVCAGKDWVEWISNEGEISDKISWKSGSPFDEAPKYVEHNNKKVLKSKPPLKTAAGRGFDYEIELVVPGVPAPVRIDPRIEIIE